MRACNNVSTSVMCLCACVPFAYMHMYVCVFKGNPGQIVSLIKQAIVATYRLNAYLVRHRSVFNQLTSITNTFSVQVLSGQQRLQQMAERLNDAGKKVGLSQS